MSGCGKAEKKEERKMLQEACKTVLPAVVSVVSTVLLEVAILQSCAASGGQCYAHRAAAGGQLTELCCLQWQHCAAGGDQLCCLQWLVSSALCCWRWPACKAALPPVARVVSTVLLQVASCAAWSGQCRQHCAAGDGQLAKLRCLQWPVL